MARIPRTRMSRSLICVLAVSCLAASPSPRVRSTNPAIAAAIAEAQSRSATFRSLIHTIEATDGIVYVEPGRCGHGVPACLSLSVVSGGGFRLLRILVDGTAGVISLMATIGHELRHAIELLTEPAVNTWTAAYLYYQREAPTLGGVFETSAAILTGAAVEHELKDAADLVRVAEHAGDRH
jgi:hypothetical protein